MTSTQDVVALIRQYVLPVGSHVDSDDEQESTTTPPLPERPAQTSTPSLPNRPTSTPSSSLPRRPVPSSTPSLPVRPIPSTTPATSSQDIVGLIRQYVLPVGSHTDSSAPTNTPTATPRRPVPTSTRSTAQRILDTINANGSNSNSSSPNTVTPPVAPTVTPSPAADSICRDVALVNNSGVNLLASACTSAPKAGALPKITIVNNLGACLDSATRNTMYENQVIQVNRAGTDLFYSANRYCNPNLAYPPVIARGSSGNFSVSEAVVRTTTYYLNIFLGSWDQAFDIEPGEEGDFPTAVLVPNCWDRDPEEITNMTGDLVNKNRRIKIDHPKDKDVTVYLSRFFPACSYSDSAWQSSLTSGLGGAGAI